MVRLRCLLCLSLLLILAATVGFAQSSVTTGSISGVTSDDTGGRLPGVTIEAVHLPTNTRYAALTGPDGRFLIPNVRVGGPFRVTASLDNFRTEQKNGIQVKLGEMADIDLRLKLAAAEAITVTAEADPIINPGRTGSTSAVSKEQLESLPTVNRSLQDFARTNPYFRVDPSDISSTRMNVAGRNNRYNQIQIDGAVNNDLFGLADTGTPGGQTDAQPISVEAIQELQLVVSAYDVRQGGFTGGGVNAVTRSGTNSIDGSVFYSMRSPDLVGDGPRGTQLSDFDHTQYGVRLGGPIVRDRLFFFVTGELGRRAAPTGVSADGSAATNYNNANFPAARLRELLMTRYQYDPGPLSDFSTTTDSDNYFARLDANMGSKHRLTLRHNYVDATRDVVAGRSGSRFTFPTATYTIADETNSSVAQLNSVFSANFFNEARVGFQTIRDVRALPVIFPSIEIGGSAQNGTLTAGSERFSGANALDQDVLEVTDDITWTLGNHTVVVGTHNELFSFKNLFLSDVYGAYFFPTMAAFEAGQATEYRISYATGADPRRPTSFDVAQYGFYVSDQWRPTTALTLTLGVRADIPSFGDTPSFNERVQTLIGYNTAVSPREDAVWSPRLGFNWQIPGNQQLRGGIGVFAGRTPYVWVSNAYAGTGVEQASLTCLASANCAVPVFNPDPNNQPRNLGAAGVLTVDITDPEFEFPRVLRATLGYDRELFFGVKGTIEGIWSQTQKDVFYYNVNLKPSGTSPLDGRPTYSRVSTGMSDAYLLTNTESGDELTATLQLNRPFRNGWVMGTSYAWQQANSAFDATSSRAVSNWRFRHTKGDLFDPDDVSRSAFEVEHRANANISYNRNTGPLSHAIGLFYNVQSGRPYSIMMGSLGASVNGDFNTSNDLLYVPASADAFILCPSGANAAPNASSACRSSGATFSAIDGNRLFNYLESAGLDGRGRILDRYEASEPWSRQLDLHYELGFPVSRFRPMVTFDVLNVLNMIDETNGNVYFVSNQNITPVTYTGIDPTTSKPVYRENSSTFLNPRSQFTLADLRSRWTARLGLRVSF